MTYQELYKKAIHLLKENDIDSAEYNVRCLMYQHFGMGRISFIDMQYNEADKEEQEQFLNAVDKRAKGFPLQYLIGSWDFMDCELSVGEGVLIPRDDTEVCVRECIRLIHGITAPVIIDLCSGSGAIAISVAQQKPDAHIFAAELSQTAYGYLCENIQLNEVSNVYPQNKDIFEYYRDFEDNCFDIIISNPPYIRTDVIPTLQKEVQYEPKLALDGGQDGLDFYRCIAEHWIPKLKQSGKIILEIGEEQADSVSKLLESNGITQICVVKDIQNLDRVVFGTKNIE